MVAEVTTAHALYRFRAADGTLLYVGITINPGRRWRAHQRREWWHEVASITVEKHPDRAAVLAAERAAITSESPRYNVTHNRPAPVRRPAATAATKGDDDKLTPAEIRQIERALADPNHWGRVL